MLCCVLVFIAWEIRREKNESCEFVLERLIMEVVGGRKMLPSYFMDYKVYDCYIWLFVVICCVQKGKLFWPIIINDTSYWKLPSCLEFAFSTFISYKNWLLMYICAGSRSESAVEGEGNGWINIDSPTTSKIRL